jgi:hypothetical protein
MDERDEKLIQHFSMDDLKWQDHLEDLGVGLYIFVML